MSFAVYTEGSSNDVYKDGHKMFNSDVVKELNRKSYLEEKILQSATPTNKSSTKFCTCDMGNRWRVLQSFITNDFILCPTCGVKLSRLDEPLQNT